jgi:hypothetical protein
MTAGTVVVVVVVSVSVAVVVTADSVVAADSEELSGANALTALSELTFCTVFPHDCIETIENTAATKAAILAFVLSIPIPSFVWICLYTFIISHIVNNVNILTQIIFALPDISDRAGRLTCFRNFCRMKGCRHRSSFR